MRQIRCRGYRSSSQLCQIRSRIVQVTGVLRLIVVGVDLVAGRYQEIRIQLCDGRIERLIPAYGIGLRIACADLRVTGEDEAEASSKSPVSKV